MAAYLLLLTPSSNRVYAGSAPQVTAAELGVLALTALGAAVTRAEPTTLAGVAYLEIELDGDPRPEVLGQLAAAHGLFVREGALLRPLPLARTERLDDDLLTIPKYPGRTNEQFTRVLLNVTLASTAWADEMTRRRFTVLDPLAGRGTTLSWALALGHDAVGVEIEKREVEAYAAFLTTWLRRKRLKHQIDLHPLRRNGTHVADLLEAQLSPDPAAYRTGDRQRVTLYAADTLATPDLLQNRTVDAIVTDAPYGVAHGSRAGGARDRSPAELLSLAVPRWTSVLRPGGAVGIAWNTHGLTRDDLAAICADAGLAVCDAPPYLGFAHRVDAGIHRDILVARKC